MLVNYFGGNCWCVVNFVFFFGEVRSIFLFLICLLSEGGFKRDIGKVGFGDRGIESNRGFIFDFYSERFKGERLVGVSKSGL